METVGAAAAAEKGAQAPPVQQQSSKKKEKKEKKLKELQEKKEQAKKADTGKRPESGKKPETANSPKEGKRPESARKPETAHSPKEGDKTAKDGAGEAPGGGPQLSKAELKKQRREKQEADRLAKAKAKEEKEKGVVKKEAVKAPDNVTTVAQETQKKDKKPEKEHTPKRKIAQKKVHLFSHLQQFERETSLTQSLQGGYHPAMLKLGLQYASGLIQGSNARCVALLHALKQLIADYSTPKNKELCRDLANKIEPNIRFLNQCRPMSVSMGNAIKYVNRHITITPGNMKDSEAKEELLTKIDEFQRERIVLAAEGISNEALNKIADKDVILTYGCSSLVLRVLCDAHKQGKQFRVIVADSQPKLAGKEMLRRLVKEGISCSYVLINTVAYIMTEATKVIVGAHGLLKNGFLMSTAGTSLIALIAKSSNVPVLVCCETYKFSSRVQTDSFVFNELGDPDDLVHTGRSTQTLKDWRVHTSLTLLNLVYDFTPPELITLVVTELGMIPCTSVPVVLRRRQEDIQ